MLCAKKRFGPFFQAGQRIFWANERRMNRERTSLRHHWHMGYVCLEIKQIQMGKRWQVKLVLQKWLKKGLCRRWQPSLVWNSTRNQQTILIYISLQLHRLPRKHDNLCKIWPQSSRGGNLYGKLWKTVFRLITTDNINGFSFACILDWIIVHFKNNIFCGSNIPCIFIKGWWWSIICFAKQILSHWIVLSPTEVVTSCQMTFEQSSFVIDLSRLTLRVSEGERTYEKPGRVTHRGAGRVI